MRSVRLVHHKVRIVLLLLKWARLAFVPFAIRRMSGEGCSGQGGYRAVAIAEEEGEGDAPLSLNGKGWPVFSLSRAWLRLVGGPALSLSRRYPVMPSNHGQPLTITVKYDFERSHPRRTRRNRARWCRYTRHLLNVACDTVHLIFILLHQVITSYFTVN